MTYPVRFEVDFAEKRSRLTTFFRYLLVLPHLVVLMLLGIAVYVTVLVSWFALLFTARYPEGLYRFNGNVLRYITRVSGYLHLLADPYPPFGLDEAPDYPIRVVIGPPKESYSRLKVLFRFLLALPVYIINYALSIVAYVTAVISWFWIVIAGKQNPSLHSAIVLGVGYNARATAYFFLLTEDWPPFGTEEPAAAV